MRENQQRRRAARPSLIDTSRRSKPNKASSGSADEGGAAATPHSSSHQLGLFFFFFWMRGQGYRWARTPSRRTLKLAGRRKAQARQLQVFWALLSKLMHPSTAIIS